MRTAVLSVLTAAALTLPACELATHALDYNVDPAALLPLCDPCPDATAGLRHPPCPVASTAPDTGGPLVFAARRASFGETGPLHALDLGLDLDCSTRRARGLPVLCTPRSRDGWAPLPGGIDDALLQRALLPAAMAAKPKGSFTLGDALSSAFASGSYGFVVVLERYNGEPDDPDVDLTVRASPGLVSGAAPAWDGADVWARFPDVDDTGGRPFHIERLHAYVAGGTLVADARERGPMLFRFGEGHLAFDLVLTDLSFTATITPTGLSRFTWSGAVDLPAAHAAASALAAASSICNPSASAFLTTVAGELPEAADMPTDRTAPPSAACDAVSFAWSFDAEPARLGGVVTPPIKPPVGDQPGCE
jgi:hypothetical protein